MRAGFFSSFLAGILFVSAAFAQPVTEGESHIASAFTSGADPGVFAGSVRLGPALRRELGSTDSRAVYDALFNRVAGASLKVDVLPPGEATRYAKLVGSLADPLILVQGGGVTLLMQYATASKQVTFVEQVSAPTAR